MTYKQEIISKIKVKLKKIIREEYNSIIREDQSYEGWTNKDTKLVCIYLDNEEPLYRTLNRFKGRLTVNFIKKVYEVLKLINPKGYKEINKRVVNWPEVLDYLNQQ